MANKHSVRIGGVRMGDGATIQFFFIFTHIIYRDGGTA